MLRYVDVADRTHRYGLGQDILTPFQVLTVFHGDLFWSVLLQWTLLRGLCMGHELVELAGRELDLVYKYSDVNLKGSGTSNPLGLAHNLWSRPLLTVQSVVRVLFARLLPRSSSQSMTVLSFVTPLTLLLLTVPCSWTPSLLSFMADQLHLPVFMYFGSLYALLALPLAFALMTLYQAYLLKSSDADLASLRRSMYHWKEA
jgi:hypothetical protein